MTDVLPEGQSRITEYRAVVNFSVDPEQAADPSWRERVTAFLSGLGEAAGVDLVSVQLGPAGQTDRYPGGAELRPDNPDLRRPTSELFAPQTTADRGVVTRIINALLRDNLMTARDVLAAGKKWIEDIRNLNVKSVGMVESTLQGMGFVLEEQPRVAYIAQIFERPEDVPIVAVLQQRISGFERVGDLLTSEDDLAHKLRKRKPGRAWPNIEYEPDYEAARDVIRKTRSFIDQFGLEQERSRPQ